MNQILSYNPVENIKYTRPPTEDIMKTILYSPKPYKECTPKITSLVFNKSCYIIEK